MATDQQVSMQISLKDKVSGTAGKIKKELKDIKKNADDINSTNFDNFVNNLSLGALARGLFEVGEKMIEFTKQSSDYIETLNVLDVAFDGNTQSIREFTSAISETLNLDDATLIKSVSSFKTLANSMQYTNEVGTEFSKMLTQMTLDLSSLYNMDFKKAQSALQYAIQGQGKTLKALTGASVLETTIQTTLDTLGIDAYVENMTDAEKAMARVITITYQLQNSQGDLARTIESPANQFRVLGEQITLLARNIGNILLPAIASVLPYLNAILIVVNTLLKGLATLFGFSETSWDFFESGSNSFDNLGASIGGVGDSASKAKKQLQGLREFDKLNVIKTPNQSGGAGGGAGGGVGGINPELLKAFDDIFANYNTNLDGVKTKATQIAEDILRWLNFTKEINPETGKIEWKFQGIDGLLSNMWKSFKGLSTTGKILVGLGFIKGLSSILTIGKKVLSLLGNTGLFKAIKNLISPSKTLLSSILGFTKANKNLTSGIKDGIKYWRLQNIEVYNADGTLNKFSTNVNKATSTIKGLATAVIGLSVLNTSFKSIEEEGANLLNVLGAIGGSFTTIVSGIQIGASLGGTYGAVIGGIAGAFAVLVSAISNFSTELDPLNEKLNSIKDNLNSYNEEMKKTKELAEEDLVVGLKQQDWYKEKLERLDDIVDAQGRVKSGYEDEVNYILNELNGAYGTNYQMINGQIEKYDELTNKIKLAIQQKEAEYYLEKQRKLANKALEQENGLYKELNDAIEVTKERKKQEKEAQIELEEAQKNYKEALDKTYASESEQFKAITDAQTALANKKSALQKATEETKKAMEIEEDATIAYKNNQLEQIRYSELKTAYLSGDYDTLAKANEEYANSYIKNGEVIRFNDDMTTNQRILNNAIKLESDKNTNKQSFDDYIKTLKDETQAVEDITDEQAEKWATLAIADKDAFLSNFAQLPEDIQQKVVNKMYEKGYSINEQLQNGLNKNKPSAEVKFNANTTNLTTGVQSWFNRNSSSLSKANVGFQLPKLTYAGGGLPPIGQMFIANERGPELVGEIGGQTFVANQNQMMDIIDKKLHNAGGLQNATFVIQVGSEEVARTVLKDLNSMAKSNGKPITIGG